MKPDLSTPSTTFTPIVLSFSAESVSSLRPSAGSFFDTSSAAACTHSFSCALRLFQVFSLTQMQLLFASCSVIESVGATAQCVCAMKPFTQFPRMFRTHLGTEVLTSPNGISTVCDL